MSHFTGDFDFLPLLAHIEFGMPAQYPTSNDVQLAQCRMFAHTECTMLAAACAWHLETTKSRYCADGAGQVEISRRVAARLYTLAVESQ